MQTKTYAFDMEKLPRELARTEVIADNRNQVERFSPLRSLAQNLSRRGVAMAKVELMNQALATAGRGRRRGDVAASLACALPVIAVDQARTGAPAGRARSEPMPLETVDLTPRIGTELKTDVATLVSGEYAKQIKALG